MRIEQHHYPQPSKGLTPDELHKVTQLVRFKIQELVPDLDSLEWAQGLSWYAEANAWSKAIAKEYGLTLSQVAWMVALTSPLNNWDQNRMDVIDLIETGECGALPLGKGRALDVLEGADPLVVAGGRKVRSFGRNIELVDSSHDVTIDTHMVNVLNLPPRYIERKGIYDAVSDGFRQEADALGVRPHQLQAALWLMQRER